VNLITVYFGGLLTEIPVLVVQVLIARMAARRWPRFRWLAYAVAALPFVLAAFDFPTLPFDFRLPGWFYFLYRLWLYGSFPVFIVYWAIRALGRLRRSPRAAKNAEAAVSHAQAEGEPADPSRRDLLKTAAFVGACVPAGAVLYGAFVERTGFRVREVTIPIPNLPADLSNLRIVQLTDIHLGPFLSRKDLSRVVDAAIELKPDVALHTGDLISGPGDPLLDCIEEVARIKPTAGAFGCNGNHEIYAKAQEIAKLEAGRRGIRILRGETETLRFGQAELHLSGIDYQPFYTRKHYLRGAEILLKPGAVNVLMSHNPDVFPIAAKLGFDLVVGGHTHGGQVRMEILHQDANFARFYTPYVAGLYQENGKACYVSRGVGSIGVPVRIGAAPEISLIRLTRA
jgi:predicted MPP superfamily phosphohydrolase